MAAEIAPCTAVMFVAIPLRMFDISVLFCTSCARMLVSWVATFDVTVVISAWISEISLRALSISSHRYWIRSSELMLCHTGVWDAIMRSKEFMKF